VPIYEYRCPACGAVVEILQRMDAPAPLCVECSQDAPQAPAMVKQVSRSSFVLKGGGWASDGYK
jgi:putative FmdB family regulatory protein